MFQLIAMHAMLFITITTSIMGAGYLLRGAQIFDLRITTRNFMYVGASCAMATGFLGATVSAGQQVTTLWHYAAAAVLALIGLCATAHMTVDLSDRLRILKRSPSPEKTTESVSSAASTTAATQIATPAPTAKIYDLSLYRAQLSKQC